MAKRRSSIIGTAVATAVVVLTFVLLMPMLRRTRSGARGVSCLSHTKQLGLALAQYAQDYDAGHPWRVGADHPQAAWLDLGMLFPDYSPTFKAYFCPDARDRMWDAGEELDYPSEPFTSSEACGVYGAHTRCGAHACISRGRRERRAP